MRRLSGYLSAAGIALVSALLLLPLGARAQSATAVFERVKDSVFVVKALDAKGAEIALGSAVLLPDGKFATNQHVVKEGASFRVGRGKLFVDATVYAADGDKDIAILEAPNISGKAIQMGSTATLKVGQPVYAVGAPQGLELSISEGIVSQLRGGPPPIIQTTAAISPGSSGGGLFDSEGRLVGLTALYLEGGQNLNFALPIEWIAKVKPGVWSAKERSQADWLARAVELEGKYDWGGLRDWCLAWTRSEPTNADAWFVLGFAYQFFEQYKDAVNAYSQAVHIDPKHDKAWFGLGFAFFGLQQYTDAINAYHKSLFINPAYALAWCNLATIFDKLGRHTDADNARQQAIRIDPESCWPGCEFALQSAMPRDAIDSFRQVLRVNPQNASAWYDLGLVYDGLERYSDAIDAYRQVVRITPENADAWIKLGGAYFSLKLYSDSIDAYKKGLRINPDNASAWFDLGLAYYKAGHQNAALDVVKTLRHLDPERADELLSQIVPR